MSASNAAAPSLKSTGISDPYGQSGRLTSIVVIPVFLTVSIETLTLCCERLERD